VYTAEDNFHDMPAAGAGDVEGDRLAHYPFHDGSDHRIKVIEALIQQVKSFVQAVDFLAWLRACGSWVVLFGQSAILLKSQLTYYTCRLTGMSKEVLTSPPLSPLSWEERGKKNGKRG
jgi:hypothetical protein